MEVDCRSRVPPLPRLKRRDDEKQRGRRASKRRNGVRIAPQNGVETKLCPGPDDWAELATLRVGGLSLRSLAAGRRCCRLGCGLDGEDDDRLLLTFCRRGVNRAEINAFCGQFIQTLR